MGGRAVTDAPVAWIASSCLLALALLALIAPVTSRAAEDQILIMEDDPHILWWGSDSREDTLGQFKLLGADRVRLVILWRYYLKDRNAAQAPRGYDNFGSSAAYSEKRVAELDQALRDIRRHGMQPQLTVMAASGGQGHWRIPVFAERGLGRPDPNLYARFLAALARRYAGGGTDARGRPLPRVAHWAIWNEPNSGRFLQPQWKKIGGEWVAWSPVVYRELYRPAAQALRTNGHRDSHIYIGETAASTHEQRREAGSILPSRFARELGCLDDDWGRFRGEAARARHCSFQPFPRFDSNGWAHHFYSPDDATVPALSFPRQADEWTPSHPERTVRAISGLTHAGVLPDVSVFNTEAGFRTASADDPGISWNAQAASLNFAEYLQWKTQGVRSFAQYEIYDDHTWETGLRTSDGTVKGAYWALYLPIVASWDDGLVNVWGAAPSRAPDTPVELWRRTRGGDSHVETVVSDESGYFSLKIPGRAGDEFYLRNPENIALQSRVAKAGEGPGARVCPTPLRARRSFS